MTDSLSKILGRPDERTPEQRAADDEARETRRDNEEQRELFEKDQERRADYLAMDHRIRSIANEEAAKAIYMLGALGLLYGLDKTYGWLGVVGGIIFIGVALWYSQREQEKTPSYRGEEAFQLGEEAELHARMVALGDDWIRIKNNGDWECSHLWDAPFWLNARSRAQRYTRMTHKQRRADCLAARRASLPLRVAALAKLRAISLDAELPYVARINDDDRATQ